MRPCPVRVDQLVAEALTHRAASEPAAFDVPSLDALVGEVGVGDVVLVGGHPGAPADALVLAAALAAARRGEPTVLVSAAASTRALAMGLVSTTGLPLDVLWAGRVPEVVVDAITESFRHLPLWVVDGRDGVRGVAQAITDSCPSARCLAVLELRWLEPHEHTRLLLFELHRLARSRRLRTFVSVDTKLPGPLACENPLRPDLFADPALLTLADVTLLLTAPWVFREGHARTFDAAVVAPAARIGVVRGLHNPRHTLQIRAHIEPS